MAAVVSWTAAQSAWSGALAVATGIVIALISTLAPIALVAAIIAAIVAARRQDEEEPVEPGIGGVRRLFLYGLAFIALIFAGVGLSLLVSGTLSALTGALVIADSDTELAIALSFTLVGAPTWLIFAWLAQRSVAQHPVEQRSQLRRLYLVGVRGIAFVIVVINAVPAVSFLFGLEDFRGGPWGWLATWAAIWWLHGWMAAREPASTVATRLLDRLALYFGAVVGLWMLLAGLVGTLWAPLSAIYDQVARDMVISGSWHEDLRASLAIAIVGGVAWWWHWLRGLLARDAGTTLWYVYLFIFGVTAALTATIGGAATLLYLVLEWAIGVPGALDASTHFRSAVGATSVVAIGTAGWTYHRLVLREGTPEHAPWTGPERVYRYLVAGAGLIMLAGGAVTLLATAIDLVTPREADIFQQAGWWRNPLSLGLTFLIVGLPLWLRYWTQAQREASLRGEVERGSLARRVYVFGVFCIGTIVVLVDLVVILFQFFDRLLDGRMGWAFFGDTRWSIALVLVAGAFGAYYWLVLREDQAATPAAVPLEAGAPAPAPARPREVTVIARGPVDDLVRALERPGLRVRVWQRLDDSGGSAGAMLALEDVDALRQRVLQAPGEQVLLLILDGRVEVVPYQAAGR